jgi:hypothetical protein
LFESIRTDETAARFRAAAFPPLAGGVLALLYLSTYPLLPRVPAVLFWGVDAILLAATVWGAVRLVRALRQERLTGPLAGWAAGAAAAEVLCAWLFLSFTFPWI